MINVFRRSIKVVVQLGQEFVKRWTRVLESGVSGLPTDESFWEI